MPPPVTTRRALVTIQKETATTRLAMAITRLAMATTRLAMAITRLALATTRLALATTTSDAAHCYFCCCCTFSHAARLTPAMRPHCPGIIFSVDTCQWADAGVRQIWHQV
eukprot:SM002057S06542  [mRNA]  locus=s2057:1234:1563:- [translate_table: standard]